MAPSVNSRVLRDGRTVYFVRTRDSDGRQTSERFDVRRDAERFAKRVTQLGGPAAISERARTDPTSQDFMPTLADWLPHHIEQLSGVTERTRLDYLAMAKRTWLPLIGDLPLDAIDRAMIAGVVNALERQGLAAKSIHNAHALLSATFTSALDAEHVTANPCVRVRLPRAREDERRDERFLTHEEYERLLASTAVDLRPFVAFLFGSGMRWGEITALTIRDVALRGPVPIARVTKAWKRTPGKGVHIGPPKTPKARRGVVLSSPAVEAVLPLLGRDADDLLFQTPAGRPLHHANFRIRTWVPACDDANLTPRPRVHDARHTHASWLLEHGATLEQVQDQLGHESILTTRKIYGHLQPAMRLSLYEAASRAMQPRALD